jgi:hypothetical protein
MQTGEPLSGVSASGKQLRVDVKEIHGCVATDVTWIGVQEVVKACPMTCGLPVGRAVCAVSHAPTSDGSSLSCLVRLSGRGQPVRTTGRRHRPGCGVGHFDDLDRGELGVVQIEGG